MYDLISGVFGSAFGGAFGLSPADTGAAAQRAGAEDFQRPQMGAAQWHPTAEQQIEMLRGMRNSYVATGSNGFAAWRERVAAEKLPSVDWLYWGLLAGMALALIVRWWVSR